MIHEEAEAVKAPRVEDRARVTGSTLYVDDIPFDRLLYVEILRSRHAHARLLRVDAARARAAPGVAAAITYADLESSTGSFPLAASRVDDLRQPATSFLARDEVGFVGEPVAAVAAETRAAARD
ncbi:MAG TPA: xanthine dehydrogenase family protein molybdopterin-binding subunit, partial [Planctomycetota bacterium]|nr:xanthine dehydrogenase family protein molybdopterin-binding subunit [Planctomycetota bacterium]